MYAPLLYTSFGFWMYSNAQIFANDVNTMMTLSVSVNQFEPALDWPNIISSYPMIIGFFFILALLLTKEKWSEALTQYYPTGADALNGEEVLDAYFDSLDLFQKQWWYMEELLSREQLGLTILSDFAYHKFDKEFDMEVKDRKRDPIQGCFCYDILCNRRYEDAFQYLPYCTEDRNDYIIDGDDDEDNDGMQSDLVRLILNLAFLPEEKARAFKFDAESYKKLKKPLSLAAQQSI